MGLFVAEPLTTLGRFDWPTRQGDPNAITPEGSLENPRTPWDAIFEIERADSGVSVTEANSLQVAAVWRCVSLISGAVARTPLNAYRRTPDGKVRAIDHYLWRLFRYQANPFMTSYRFKRLMQTWVLLWGNAYAEIEINGRGQVVGLWPWRPDRVHISGLAPDMLVYHYTMLNGEEIALPAPYIFHLRGLELDGIMGIAPIKAAKQAVGLAKAAEAYGARYFANNGKPGGYLKHPGKLGAEAKKNIRETHEALHRGIRGAHRIAVLEEGMEYTEVGVPPEDMQFLQTRQFQGIDIARLFGVPPHKIAELARATFSNIEHQSIEFVNDCLDDWFCNWCAEAEHSLLSDTEAKTVYVEFFADKLIRGDMAARNAAFAQARQWGWMNVNEIRTALNMNSIGPAGDVYLQPLNMAPAGTVPTADPAAADDDEPSDPGALPAPAPAQLPPPEPDSDEGEGDQQ